MRLNSKRTSDSEQILSARVKYERQLRGWTPAYVAKLMSELGCNIQTSAIYRIEEDNPKKRRRITVNEHVAFAEIFDISMEELLKPPEQVVDELIDDIQKTRESVTPGLEEFVVKSLDSYLKYLQYIYLTAGTGWGTEAEEITSLYYSQTELGDIILFQLQLDDGRLVDVPHERLKNALLELELSIIETAYSVIATENNWDDSESSEHE